VSDDATDRLTAVPATRHCLDLGALAALPADPELLAQGLATQHQQATQVLAQRFAEAVPIAELVQAQAWVIEQLVLTAWQRLLGSYPDLALSAVGGFGRGEMHPQSDADLQILVAEGLDEEGSDPRQQAIGQWLQVLWDAGLAPGHSVRTPDQCRQAALEDVGVATNLMEARLLAGDAALFDAMMAQTAAPDCWPADAFYSAKLREQIDRHAQFEDTIYNLEPNIKEGPGGLRDVQMIAWVTRRHFGTATLHGLVEHGFLSEREYHELVTGRDHLWRIRWALHSLAGRAEERLLFEAQRQLSAQFNEAAAAPGRNEAVEQFMQAFYRTAMQVARLNERLLQSFDEELLGGRGHLPSGDIDAHWRLQHGYLELRDAMGFTRDPRLLVQLFLVLADHDEAAGVRASTIRLVREHLYLIDEAFRCDPEVLAMLLALLRRPRRVYAQLARMNRYGVLAALLPAFAQITGRMQFDLFHAYTVDQHTLFVIRNLRRFSNQQGGALFAHACEVFERIDDPALIYLAALFHDIAKGRGGDHSELGAEEAAAFCSRLELSPADQELVAWLVRAHLWMSRTSQREDVSDPQVVHRFAHRVGQRRRLDYLYVLTVADIAATSPRLWNSWKDSLMWTLYSEACEALERGLDQPTHREESVAETRAEALQALSWPATDVESLWQCLPERAFWRLDADQLAWTTDQVLQGATVSCRQLPEIGISEVFVYAADFAGLFAVVARELDRMQLNVLAARVITTTDGYSWDVFQVMDGHAQPLNASDTQRLIESLKERLRDQTVRALPPRPLPRRLRPFMDQAEIAMRAVDGHTRLDIAATDRPGLLSAIAEALVAQDLRLYDARIATFGQRVEDVFVIANAQGQALSEAQAEALRRELHQRLDGQSESNS